MHSYQTAWHRCTSCKRAFQAIPSKDRTAERSFGKIPLFAGVCVTCKMQQERPPYKRPRQ